MSRKSIISSFIVVAPLFAACAAPDSDDLATIDQESSVHLKGGTRAEPSFYDHGITLGATGDLSGLGAGDILVSLTASANVTSTCTNPAGANQPPGQNPAPITVTGSTPIPQSAFKNGNVSFAVTTNAPQTPIAGAPDCPNPQWSEQIEDLAFTSATITVAQPYPPASNVVLVVDCTFSPPTTDGQVPASQVTCVSR